jgi:predicted nucleic acid-binding protein
LKYWDSSALVSLLVQEAETESREQLLKGDPLVVAWWGSRIECASALSRLCREGAMEDKSLGEALRDLAALADTWLEIAPSDDLRNRAVRLLRIHPIRAADAVQLAAALIAVAEDTTSLSFVCTDGRLRQAAEKEGFQVL